MIRAMATQYLQTYNPRTPVRGRNNDAFMRGVRSQGRIAPVPKRRNPYVRPTPGGGSSSVSPSSPNAAGVNAQIRMQAARPAVSTNFEANYESDPVLARIRALGQQNVANAETEAAALRKQAILDTGMTDVGREIGLDDATLSAASSNPVSLLAQLARDAQTRGRDLDESLNQQNLFFSGHRASQLGELATNQAAAQAELARDLRSALGGIDAGVLQARQTEAQNEQQALAAAAEAQRQRDFEQAYWDALYPPDPVTPYGSELIGGGSGVADSIDYGGGWFPSYESFPGNPEFTYQPEPVYTPPPLTPEEELMLALGMADSAFTQYAM